MQSRWRNWSRGKLRPSCNAICFFNPDASFDQRIEAAREILGIADVIVTARPGDVFLRSNDRRPSAAMALATGATRDIALSAANEALTRIHIVIEPTG